MTDFRFRIQLIRLGKTKSNEEQRYLGTTDEPISPKGRADILQKRGQYEEPDFLYVSPMRRCVETGQLLFPGRTPVICSSFREMDFGDFEGKNYRELSGNPDYQAWIDSGGTLAFPNGESREAFVSRCMDGYRQMMEQVKTTVLEQPASERKECYTVAAVVHGGTIMAVCSQKEQGEYFSYQCKNGEGYVLWETVRSD